MFYLKYRPRQFSDLVGLETVSKTLQAVVASGKFGHAYLFFGPRGTGKTTTARLLAKALNCVSPVSSSAPTAPRLEPCNACEACVAISGGRWLDLVEIDAASNRGIDDIRELRERVRLAPVRGKYKVYIIDEVHMLTAEAFNALLKTLEEPPAHAVFILCTTEPRKVPATVKSRCQQLQFSRAGEEALLKRLQFICQQEGAEVLGEGLKQIARASGGSFRDAETLLEQVVTGGVSVDEVLQLSSEEDLGRFVGMVVSGDAVGAIEVVNEVFRAGRDLGVWTTGLLRYLRELLLIQVGVPPVGITGGLTGQVSQVWLGEAIQRFTEAHREMRWAAIPQLPLELAVIALDRYDSTNRSNNRSEGSGGKGLALDPPAGGAKSTGPRLSPDRVEEVWPAVLEAIKPLNHSLEAILRSTQPQALDGERLTLKVPYRFHRERLKVPANLRLVEEAVSKVLGQPVRVECVLSEPGKIGEKGEEDLPVKGSSGPPAISPLEAFTGEL